VGDDRRQPVKRREQSGGRVDDTVVVTEQHLADEHVVARHAA